MSTSVIDNRPTVSLDEGIRLHQSGQLDQAETVYRALLAEWHHPDALHLLGVLMHQRGRGEQAAALIHEAIGLRPEEPAYHSNLAEVHRVACRFREAAAAARMALRLSADYPQAHNNLGLALMGLGEYEQAAQHFQEAIHLDQNDAPARINLGNALRELDRPQEALVAYREAVRCAPSYAQAHSNLGQALLELDKDRLDEAERHCRRAVELLPQFAEAHNNLGNVLREQGNLAEAMVCYQRAIRQNPSLAMAYNNMGQALQEDDKLLAAIAWYQQAVDLEPNNTRILCNLASAYEEQENHNAALQQYEKALQIDSECVLAHRGIGDVLRELDRVDEAVIHFRRALEQQPDFAPIHNQLGHALAELGQLDESLHYYRQALKIDPELAGAHANLALALRGDLPDDDVSAIRQLLADLPTVNPRRIDDRGATLHLALAQVLDGKGDYDAAAGHLRQGNLMRLRSLRRRGKEYDPDEHSRFVDQLLATFTPEWLSSVAGVGNDSPVPTFIIGMPRSGTTLTEQILASHPRVFGAGELRLTRESFESLPHVIGCNALPIECVPHLAGEMIRQVAQTHLDCLISRDNQAARVVDKMPDNYLYVGLIVTLFPRARIIHCRRDVRDVATSCWITNFAKIRWACDLEHIARRVLDYQRVMAHWRKVLPGRLLEIDYEETVADQEKISRQLIDWIGLEWDPACLAFHETHRPVRTASMTQVRQPIHSRSVARWKRYETALEPLLAMFD